MIYVKYADIPKGGVGRAGVTACAWAIKMGFVQPHPSLLLAEQSNKRIQSQSSTILPQVPPTSTTSNKTGISFFSSTPKTVSIPPTTSTISTAAVTPELQVNGEKVKELEHQIIMSIVERVVAMIRSRRGLKAIESFEQVQFLAVYVGWLRAGQREREEVGAS